jgi:hypothetical protein
MGVTVVVATEEDEFFQASQDIHSFDAIFVDPWTIADKGLDV